ncbi:MAG: T9SS type A sorting domain-containing protein [Bacteroidetes bacterium]|nr:T9SS type A sorting domain-containing protein [Bacteroidota bacterium]
MRNTIFLIFALFTFSSLLANDDCSNALAVPVANSASSCVSTSVNTAGSTQSSDAASCISTSQDDDVWYSFVATSTDITLKVSNVNSSNGNNTIYAPGFVIYEAGCGGTEIRCDARVSDNGGTNDTLQLHSLIIGETYYVRTFFWGGPNSGTFDLCAFEDAPSNDECATPTYLSTGIGPVCNILSSYRGTTSNATASAIAESSCGSAVDMDDDVWFTFYVYSANTTVEVTGLGNFDAVVEVYSGCSAGSLVACQDSFAAGATEKVRLTGLTVGSFYFVRVADYNNTVPSNSQFDICIYDSAPTSTVPPNDNCSGAITINVGANANACSGTAVNTNNATQSSNPSNCLISSQDDDVWYKFVATGSTIRLKVLNRSSTSTYAFMSVYSGSCSGTEIKCRSQLTGDTLLLLGLVVGNTYYVRTGYNGSSTRGTFNICAYQTSPAAINDVCGTGAITLSVGTSCNFSTHNTAGAAAQNPPASCSGGNVAEDVWFKFVAPTANATVKVSGQTNFDAVVEVYSTCSSTVALGCSDNPSAPAATEQLSFTNLVPNNTYYVRVYDYFPSTAGNSFDICIFDSITANSIITNQVNIITVFPNPATNKVEIQNLSLENGVNEVVILNTNGQVVKKETVAAEKILVSVSDLPRGLYIVRTSNSKHLYINKLILD